MENQKPKKLVGCYMRFSTDNQDLLSQKAQVDSYMDFYKNSNDVIFRQDYVDEGISGSNTNRPKLKELMQAVKDKAINCVVITKLDRLARSVDDLRSLVRFFEENDCALIIIKENIDTKTPQGRLFFTMMSAFIEFERETIVQRMKDGLEYARKNGSKSGKPCHRPKKELDMVKLRALHSQGMSINAMAKVLEVSRVTIRDRIKNIY